MTRSGRYVHRERRVDETIYHVKEVVAPNIIYEGRTEGFATLDAEPLWQIKRYTSDGVTERTVYANDGKYNCRWDLRATYFPAPPLPIVPTQPILGAVNIYPGTWLALRHYAPTAAGLIVPISYTLPGLLKLNLYSFTADCRQEIAARVKAGSVVVGSVRTGAARPTETVPWTPPVEVASGTVVTVEYERRAGAPTSDIGLYLEGSLVP